VGNDVPVTAGIIDGVECTDAPDSATGVIYGINDVVTANSGRVCFWLPATGSSGTDVGGVGLVVNGADYELSYARPESAPADKALLEPTITSVEPDGTSEPLNGEIEITFNVGMKTSLAGTGTVVLQPSSGDPITLGAGTWSSDNTVYTASYSGLLPLTSYTIEISGFETSILKLTLPPDDTHRFMTGDSFTATITPSIYNFGTLDKGYTSPVHTFTITNTGSGPLSDLNVFIEGPDATAFTFTSALSPLGLSPLATYTLAPGQHVTVEAHPVSGLAPRSAPYTATLRVTASDGIDLAAPLSFTVKANGGGGGGGGGNLPNSGDASTLILAVAALTLATLGATAITTATRHRRRKLYGKVVRFAGFPRRA
jgi:hypothetical protein